MSQGESTAVVPIVCQLSEGCLKDIAAIEALSGDPVWSARQLAAEFNNECARIFGARVAAKLRGFLVTHVILDEMHILKLAVAPESQRQGIGRALVTETLTDLYWEGTRWATLEVRVSNIAAQKLYDSLGFVAVGRREKYYTNNDEDACVMALSLEDFMSRQPDKSSRVVNY